MRPLQARSRLTLGRLHLSTGRVREARNDLTQAAEDLRTMGMMLWVAEAEALLAAQDWRGEVPGLTVPSPSAQDSLKSRKANPKGKVID